MSKPRTIRLKSHSDARGQLVVLEVGRELPFEVKRVYCMSRMIAELPRGFHAHRNLEQVAVCVAGSCTVIIDDGRKKSRFNLNRPDVGLYIGNYMWREMHDFSDDCVLMVLASEHYSEDDYIRDYDRFILEVNANEN